MDMHAKQSIPFEDFILKKWKRSYCHNNFCNLSAVLFCYEIK